MDKVRHPVEGTVFFASMNSSELINAIETSIELAEQGKSKLTEEILAMEGMSGNKSRHFLNNLLNRGEVRYLEIGTWKGSTLVASHYLNSIQYSIAIDNFSQYGGPREEFKENCKKFLGKVPNFIDGDCFLIDPVKYDISDINIYFYDGEHSSESQRKALQHYYSQVCNEFVFMVDDWNWESVQLGTNQAIQHTGAEVLYKKEIFTDNHAGDRAGWWNGWGIFVLKKKM